MSNTHQPSHHQLENGQIIPVFTLPGTDGMPHGPWDYKQREHLILLFIRGITTNEEREFLQAFSKHYASFREEMCAILLITAAPVIVNLQRQEELHLPFPLLSDPKGEIISRYTNWENTKKSLTPCIILADRYGALYQQWIAENEAELPRITQLLEVLQYLNTLCTP